MHVYTGFDSEYYSESDVEPVQNGNFFNFFLGVLDLEGDELSDTEIEGNQKSLYCIEAAQIMQARELTDLDPDWLPHCWKWKLAHEQVEQHEAGM